MCELTTMSSSPTGHDQNNRKMCELDLFATSEPRQEKEVKDHNIGFADEEVEEIDDYALAANNDEPTTNTAISSCVSNHADDEDDNVNYYMCARSEEEMRNVLFFFSSWSNEQHHPGCIFKEDPFGPFSTCCRNLSKKL